MTHDPVAVALAVAEILEQLGLRYLVGGSLASSMSGEPRSTLDVDIVVALAVADVEPLVRALGVDFNVNEHAVLRAVQERSSVNVFHRASSIKVDLFVLGGSPLDAEPMARRRSAPARGDGDRSPLSPRTIARDHMTLEAAPQSAPRARACRDTSRRDRTRPAGRDHRSGRWPGRRTRFSSFDDRLNDAARMLSRRIHRDVLRREQEADGRR